MRDVSQPSSERVGGPLNGIRMLETVSCAYALGHGVGEHVEFSISLFIRAVNYPFDLLICPDVAVKHPASPSPAPVNNRQGCRGTWAGNDFYNECERIAILVPIG
jgi:hypothetical protein